MRDPGEISDPIIRGWAMAEATLAAAASELTLVTHWFLTPDDASVNADEHFGSDARTLRFLGVALPTLLDQLGATAAIVSIPWAVGTDAAALTVLALAAGEPARIESRRLLPRDDGPGPPFWVLDPGRVPVPGPITAIADLLAI